VTNISRVALRATRLVRKHNARVRQNRSRLNREIARLSSSTSTTKFVTYRTSVQNVHQFYERLEARAEAGVYPDRFNELLDLSEREVANNAGLMNALLGEPEESDEVGEPFASDIDPILDQLATDARDRWRGALFSLAPENPDAARHFCTSARELLTNILDTFAPNETVLATLPDCDKIPSGGPSRRAKIAYFLHIRGMADDELEDFVDEDLDSVIKLFRTFNDGTHGSSGKFSHGQLLALKKRVENSVHFLWHVIPVSLQTNQ
jgi:hypothetical protein